MSIVRLRWQPDRAFELVLVQGTHGRPFAFGAQGVPVEIQDFYIATVPVTQDLWTHIMGSVANPAAPQHPDLPVENVSWDEITRDGGFLDQINAPSVRANILRDIAPRTGRFRLPSETEWEYAARGGPYWRDRFRFSGSDDIDAVAWYDRKHGDHTEPVGTKAPNQLGIQDMSGNVWEWCQDVFTRDVEQIPRDGSPFAGAGYDRVVRGGCFHNWAIHCTVSKRYELPHDYHDGCVGFRLVFSLDPKVIRDGNLSKVAV